jgi:2-oxoglutarate dehydrogenase E1 component
MASSPLSGISLQYLDAMQAAFDRDPASVEPGWRVIFQVLAEMDARRPEGVWWISVRSGATAAI